MTDGHLYFLKNRPCSPEHPVHTVCLALRCWKCTSEHDAICRDFFNTTRILLNQRQMQHQYSYANLQPARTDPYLSECDGVYTSTYGQVKNVCLKRVFSVDNGPNEVIRECRMVRSDFKVGACPEDIDNHRPRNLELCETCDYDGCNSATMNSAVFIVLVPVILLLLGQ
ncbi:hypothetical protein ABEB36_008837 [Hypothenemus hampei]|uniref:Protein sleepless n=1 Tax=Hypothenemus hampei TaxID=57062 RepID=A0ABD1EN74_HYPHA